LLLYFDWVYEMIGYVFVFTPMSSYRLKDEENQKLNQTVIPGLTFFFNIKQPVNELRPKTIKKNKSSTFQFAQKYKNI
jgi:hypothetical protein